MRIKEGKGKKVHNDRDVASIFYAILEAEDELDQQKEHFWIMMLNTKNVIQEIHLISLGTVNESLVHPREVYRPAINAGATHIVAVHNHPSGEVEPSEDDIKIIERLRKAGEIIGIEILDSIIIGKKARQWNYCSFLAKGLLT